MRFDALLMIFCCIKIRLCFETSSFSRITVWRLLVTVLTVDKRIHVMLLIDTFARLGFRDALMTFVLSNKIGVVFMTVRSASVWLSVLHTIARFENIQFSIARINGSSATKKIWLYVHDFSASWVTVVCNTYQSIPFWLRNWLRAKPFILVKYLPDRRAATVSKTACGSKNVPSSIYRSRKEHRIVFWMKGRFMETNTCFPVRYKGTFWDTTIKKRLWCQSFRTIMFCNFISNVFKLFCNLAVPPHLQ